MVRKQLFRVLAHPTVIAALGSFYLMVAALNRSLFEDEARWAYVAREWIHYGVPPYTGVVENKPPAIFFLYAASDWLFGHQYGFPRLVGIVCIVGTALLLYRI